MKFPMTSVLGSAFAGNLAVTASSGPGIALKGEAIGLAVITELPLVIINIQRGGLQLDYLQKQNSQICFKQCMVEMVNVHVLL